MMIILISAIIGMLLSKWGTGRRVRPSITVVEGDDDYVGRQEVYLDIDATIYADLR